MKRFIVRNIALVTTVLVLITFSVVSSQHSDPVPGQFRSTPAARTSPTATAVLLTATVPVTAAESSDPPF